MLHEMAMINRYVDIRLRPDPNFAEAHLMNALFSKLHSALVRIDSEDIGVSFPDVDFLRPSLGGCLRLHGYPEALEALFTEDWMVGMHDHVFSGSMVCVPANTSYRYVRRVHAKSSPERMRRRQMKRHRLNEEQVRAQIPQTLAQRLSLPYLTLPSRSTGQTFRLFIDHVAAPAATAGHFNAYGLSSTSTVPWF